MKDSLKICRVRENTRLCGNIGPYYIADRYRNIVVDTKLPTLEAAKESLRKVRVTQG
jgi:hypothetical protein